MTTMTRPPPRAADNATPKLGKIPTGITAPRIVLNAVEGFGKTTLGAFAPNPAILMARGETGFATLRQKGRVPDVNAVELTSWNNVLRLIDTTLMNGNYETIVIDALGGFERLCHEHVCARDFQNDWSEKGFYSYMRGYEVSIPDWIQFLYRLDALRMARSCSIILLSHAKAKTFKNPLGPDFDRYTADCHEKTWGVTHKWADAVLFGTFVTVTQEKKGRTKGIGGTERVVYAQRTDGYDAKNRYGMASQIQLPDDPAQMWSTVWNEMQRSAVAPPAAEADLPPEL